MTIPCGHCSECKKKKASDWATRGFYEFMDCMNKGGYAYFETLTYSDEFIPLTGDRNEWISKGMNNNDSVDNFAHFDHDHIHGFFARLRKKLKDSGYDVKNKLRYFIAGEYGGKTHRPHYHLILYVYDSNLLPRDLDLYIRYAWRIQYDIRFNKPYVNPDGKKYVRKEDKPFVFWKSLGHLDDSRDYNKKKLEHNDYGAILYVGKYVGKDSEFETLLYKKRLSIYEKYGDVSDNPVAKLRRDGELSEFKDFIKDKRTFHRASIGYGAQMLNDDCRKFYATGLELYFDKDNMKVQIPDKKKVKKFVSVPKYVVDKYHYVMVDDSKYYDDFDNTGKKKKHYRKVLNEVGYEYKMTQLDSKLDSMSQSFRQMVDNLSMYVPDSINQVDRARYVNDLKLYISKLLDGRSFLDFSKYLMIFRGNSYLYRKSEENRMKIDLNYDDDILSTYKEVFSRKLRDKMNFKWSDLRVNLYAPVDDEHDYIREEFFNTLSTSIGYNVSDVPEFLNTEQLKDSIERIYNVDRFFSDSIFEHNRNCNYKRSELYSDNDDRRVESRDFMYHSMIGQDSFYQFGGFDDLDSIFSFLRFNYSVMKERLSKEKEDLEKRFKLIMDKFVYRTDYSVSSTVYDKDGNEYCNVVKPLINPMTVHYNSLEEYSNVVFSELSDFDKDIDVWDFSKNVGFI